MQNLELENAATNMQNLKLKDASVFYNPKFLETSVADNVFAEISKLFSMEHSRDVTDSNKKPLYTLNRKTRAFVDSDVNRSDVPRIWGSNITVTEFPPILSKIKSDIQELLIYRFNICLVNYYDTGKNTIGWHSDNEEKGSISCIASISLGAERKFEFKRTDNKEVCKEIVLHHGSLLVMGHGCQENYNHRLPEDINCKEPRLNLTFRLFDSDRYKNY